MSVGGFNPFGGKEHPNRSYINMEPERKKTKNKHSKNQYAKMVDDEDGGGKNLKRKREGVQAGRAKIPERDSPIQSEKVFESVRDSIIENAEKAGDLHTIVEYVQEERQLEYLHRYSLEVLNKPEIASRVAFQLLFNACESGDLRKAQLQRVKLYEMGFSPDTIASLSEEDVEPNDNITPDKFEAHRILNEYSEEERVGIRQGISKLNEQDMLEAWGG